MYVFRIINLVFMYWKILILLSLLYIKLVYEYVLVNLFLLIVKKKRKFKLKKVLYYINNDWVYIGILL